MMENLKRKKVSPLAAWMITGVCLFLGIILFSLAERYVSAQGFGGPPGGAVGSGYGAIGVDTWKNLSVGTSTVLSDTKLLVMASSTSDTSYVMSVRNPPNNPIFTIRNDGKVLIGTPYHIPGGGVPFAISVQGDSYFNGIVSAINFTNGTFSGTVNATNVTPGVFNGATGGNYAVNGSLGVNYTSQVGLPKTLSVLGGGYFQNNVGIGTTNPLFSLDIVGGANFTGTVKAQSPSTDSDLATKAYVDSVIVGTTNAENCSAGATCAMNGANLNNGNITNVNKLTVATIDPLYEIRGRRYATYAWGGIGLKEQVSGKIELLPYKDGVYQALLDFYLEPEGSDLWLFAQASNLKNNLPGMTVVITPSFDGSVWYEKDPSETRLKILARPTAKRGGSLEISYQLSAPRFDSQMWPNISDDYSSTPLRP